MSDDDEEFHSFEEDDGVIDDDPVSPSPPPAPAPTTAVAKNVASTTAGVRQLSPAPGNFVGSPPPQPVIVVTSLRVPEVFARVEKEAAEFGEALGWQPEPAMALLRRFQWSTAFAEEKYFDDPQGTMKLCNIANPTAVAALHTNDKEVECLMCWDTIARKGAFALACNHWFCHSCWLSNLEFTIKNEANKCLDKRCLAKGCGMVCGSKTFTTIFEKNDPGLLTKFQEFVVKQYVEGNPNMQACPRAGCDMIVATPLIRGPECQPVACQCKHQFCFKCSEQPHAPATCEMLRAWIKKAQDDSETANWVTSYTKPCPKCQSNVEKNGGCNHMTCPKCRSEWCWVCEGEWAKHGASWYQCNYFDRNSKDDARKKRSEARSELERYMHYFTRFHNHEDSLEMTKGLLASATARTQEELLQGKTSLKDGEYLEDCVKVLSECRRTLMFSYVYAYYLESTRLKELFEFNQSQLEYTTEVMTEYIEDIQGKFTHEQVINATSVAQKKLHILQQGRSEEEYAVDVGASNQK